VTGIIAGDVAKNTAQRAAMRTLKGYMIEIISKHVAASNRMLRILLAEKRSAPANFAPASTRVHKGVVVPRTRSFIL
jgi:septum formation topological specificity factor MinE